MLGDLAGQAKTNRRPLGLGIGSPNSLAVSIPLVEWLPVRCQELLRAYYDCLWRFVRPTLSQGTQVIESDRCLRLTRSRLAEVFLRGHAAILRRVDETPSLVLSGTPTKNSFSFPRSLSTFSIVRKPEYHETRKT